MARSKIKPHHDEILEAREEAAKPKRRSRKKEPVAVSEPLEQLAEDMGLKRGDELPRQLPAPTEADLPRAAESPFEPGRYLAAEPSFVERLNPNGPRILPRHIKIIHDGRSDETPFEMGEDHAARKMVIGFREDPGQTVKDRLTERRRMPEGGEAINFQYDESKKLWHTAATPDGRERAFQAVNDISGKDVRFGYGRGR